MVVTRVAIAGIGYAGETHAQAIANLNQANVVAGACRTESKGRTFAGKFNCNWYDDIETMFDTSNPDILFVCTPSGRHLKPTLAAAERGIDVLCDKPLETTIERINRMVAAADKHGIRLAGVFQYRYDPLIRAIRLSVAAGWFGSLSVANAYVLWWRPDNYYEDNWKGTFRDGGGATLNQSLHAIDTIQ